jgi:hypothetical protein
MKLNKSKISFLLFLALFLCFSLNSFVLADDVEKRGLEVNYPIINGIEITTESTIEDYAVYFFSFAMIVGTIIAFAVLIYGGFRYVTSSGNPDAMSDAKKWILESILGLILLLSTWLIIGIINKEMLSPKIPSVEATSGIYIVDKSGEKYPYNQKMVYSIPEYIEVDHIEFLSDKVENPQYADPDKDELFSVFIYPEKNLKGKPEEIKNGGAGTTHSMSNIGSMFLLWWDPGAYFYDKENFNTDTFYPRFYDKSQMNLREFDNRAKSLRVVNVGSKNTSSGVWDPYQQTPGGFYYVVLFEMPNFNKQTPGRCALSITSQGIFTGNLAQIKNTVSSVMIFRSKEIHGEIILFDEIAQVKEKKQYKKEFSGKEYGSITFSEADLDIWNSITINANATVIINTVEGGSGDGLQGYCRPFSQLSKDGDNLKTTTVWNECFTIWCVEEYFPKRATIFPQQE